MSFVLTTLANPGQAFWSPVSTTSGATSFVFQPGGVAVDNVYTDFTLLYAAFSLIKGARTIVFDDAFAVCDIPAGTYSFLDTTALGYNSTTGSGVSVNFLLAAHVTNWFAEAYKCDFTGDCTVAPVVVMPQRMVTRMERCRVVGGVFPFFDTAGQTFEMYLRGDHASGNLSTNSIYCSAGAGGDVFCYDQTTITADAFGNDGTGTVATYADATSTVSYIQTAAILPCSHTAADEAIRVANARPYTDPALPGGVAIVLYIRTTGNDTTGTPDSLAFPFHTIEGALRQVALAPLVGGYSGSYYELNIGAGVFPLPAALPGWAGVTVVTTDVTVSDTRNVTVIVQNTPNGGNAVTLDGAAIANGALRGEIVEFLTAGLVHICYGLVYENIANTIYFEHDDDTVLNPVIAVTSVVRFLSQNSIFTQPDTLGTVFSGSDIIGALQWEGGDFSACYLEFACVSMAFRRAKFNYVQVSASLQFELITCLVSLGLSCKSGSQVWVERGTSFQDANYAIFADLGAIIFDGSVSFARIAWGAIAGIGDSDVSVYTGVQNMLRMVDCLYVVTANSDLEYRYACGGNYYMPRASTTTGLTGVTVRAVMAQGGAYIQFDPLSNIVIGGVTNPVSADNGVTLCSTAADGTYVSGGAPKPGSNGASTQYVTANADTWNGYSRTVVCTTATMGAGIFNLPAIALGVGITDSASVTIINSDGIAAVVVTPFAGEKIDNVAATFNIGAAGVKAAATLTVQKATNNYMVS